MSPGFGRGDGLLLSPNELRLLTRMASMRVELRLSYPLYVDVPLLLKRLLVVLRSVPPVEAVDSRSDKDIGRQGSGVPEMQSEMGKGVMTDDLSRPSVGGKGAGGRKVGYLDHAGRDASGGVLF